MNRRSGTGLTLRARLTVLYATVLVVAAGALLVLGLVLVDHGFDLASKTSAPASKEYISKLEQALAELGPSDGTKPAAQQDEERRQIKDQLIAANAGSGQTLRANAVNTLLFGSLLALVVLVPLSMAAGWLLARRALRPVGTITAAARRASEHQLHERLALPGRRDEVTELADTFDDMLARLEHAFDAQRRFVANASHELRTPLAVARTAIDVTMAKPDRTGTQLERMAADVIGAVSRAEQLVDGLLTLTRSQHLAITAEPADLATAAQDALDSLDNRGLTVRTDLSPAPTLGDRALLDRLVGNLIDNAVRHNQPDGWLSVHTGLHGDRAVLTVTNGGSFVPPGVVPELFEPFHRAGGRARSSEHGLGLGLSIVHAVAEAHHATLTATPRAEGGLTVTVYFPAGSSWSPPRSPHRGGDDPPITTVWS
jgi:signal transduction histidine kinase